MTQQNESAIYALLVDPSKGLGALNARMDAVHLRLDVMMRHCADTHVALDAAAAARVKRIEVIEDAKLVSNGVRKGRLEVVLVLAKILALVGVGSGGLGVLVAILRAAFGGG